MVEGPTKTVEELDPYLRILVEQADGEGRGGAWDPSPHFAHTTSLLLGAWSKLRLARGKTGTAAAEPKR